MSFRRTYDEILELIKKKLLDARIARGIVRKSGIRPGAGGSGDGSGLLFKNGDPFDAIVKLSADDYDVGWRKNGIGPVQTFNSGPPCNLRLFTFTRLRDSLLRSGTSNSGRFGYCFDPHVSLSTFVLPIPSGGTARWSERHESFAGGLRLDNQDYTDDVFNVAKDQARVICYITKADVDYAVHLDLGTVPPNRHTITRSVGDTGRIVSDWFDLPTGSSGDAAAAASIEVKNTPSLSIPTTYAELREGDGPVGCPFLDVEVRTQYLPERSYWIQDEFTPEEAQVAQWELED